MRRSFRRHGFSRDVAQQLFAIRTVPFGSLSERLYRILRGTAKELDKRANLENPHGGAQTELILLGAGEAGRPARASAAQRALPRHRAAPACARRPAEIGDGGDHADRAAGRQRNRDRVERRRRRPRSESDSRQGRRTGPDRCRRQAERRAADRLHLRAGFHHGIEAHPGLRPRHRDGRRPLADPGARRPRRGVDEDRKRDDVQAVRH